MEHVTPGLKNARQERFAQAVASGETLTKAYVTAGYVDNDSAASKLGRHPAIVARVAEITGRGAELAAFTVAKAIQEFEEARLLAKANEQPAAMVSATTGKCKVSGLLSEYHVLEGGHNPIKVDDAKDAREEIERRLAGIAARMSEQESTRQRIETGADALGALRGHSVEAKFL